MDWIKKIFSRTFFILFLFLLLMPFVGFSEQPATTGGTITNPIGKDSIQDVLLALLNVVVQIGIIAVVFFIVLSGFKMVVARGNPEELNKAKNMLWYTLIGGAIVVGAEAILIMIKNTIEGL